MRLRCLVVSHASSFRRTPLVVCATLGLALGLAHGSRAQAENAFSLTSASFRAGGTVNSPQVFDQDDCKGGNRSPQLTWRDAPPGTRSFAITLFDPDAPGRGWWHWAVAGIPASVASLPENASASGFLRRLGAVEARNDFDIDGYGGPCPPPGKPHRYVITVYALNTADLRLAQGRPALMFDHEIGTAALGSARMVVNYGR
ncbi:MAG: YbhB/YbcL family Raf kinase inhibitor-like protein [Paraburkholderia graminis]|jgi:Raf kinase inhibitor-like YbhB/YbcL family protein|uniref:PEBP family protein n=2 Tax=Paraburkholderia graminis TaxID=60548 RepID=B1GAT7_PARG4|nr:YbhB/YbcL family Raf kinase inhibitor-like protein [Paraburkholderia graminis]ALE56158.1 phosphatidylethanolamine-binding protein [Burkholderia sp. HB1]MBW8836417.1 YbhB/YbcL family Raf kinase inhibitor-like protein [Burkholderia sp.]EDT06742.1 PEBP family protein [Paraburkholderia graminis C4D1M]MDQ0620982.1 Raf kinase inhibitor-like YbhB/YbcL family protein [Paraburkholderia graminis]MDR6202318.1 Raf kinase inhibitor-like YbhB/YbcL family protein [Paraburkholderia graminis]